MEYPVYGLWFSGDRYDLWTYYFEVMRNMIKVMRLYQIIIILPKV